MSKKFGSKQKFIAVILSLLWAGFGHMYLGNFRKAITLIIIDLYVAIVSVFFIPGAIGLIVASIPTIYSIYDVIKK